MTFHRQKRTKFAKYRRRQKEVGDILEVLRASFSFISFLRSELKSFIILKRGCKAGSISIQLDIFTYVIKTQRNCVKFRHKLLFKSNIIFIAANFRLHQCLQLIA